MRLRWLRCLDQAVTAVDALVDGGVRVDFADGESWLLDADGFRLPSPGRPVAGARPGTAVAAGDRATPVTAGALVHAVACGARLELRYDGTMVEDQVMAGAVRWVDVDPDGITVLTEDGLSRWRPDLPVAALDRLSRAEADWIASAPAGRAVHPGHPIVGAGFAVRRLADLSAWGTMTHVDLDGALATLDEAAVGEPLRPDESLLVADALWRVGKVGAALPRYQSAAQDLERRETALRGAAQCLLDLGAPRAAELTFAGLGGLQYLDVDPAAVQTAVRILRAAGRSRPAELGRELLLASQASSVVRAAGKPDDDPADEPDPAPSTALDAVAAMHELRLLPGDDATSGFHAGWYHSFDHASAADTAKKTLEMVNVFGRLPAGPVTGMRTLDIGSGTLRYPQALARRGADSVGVDLERSGVAALPARTRQRFIQADGTRLPFQASTFDLVTCAMGTVNHLSSDQRGQLFAEVWRTLAPGGRLAVTAWDPRSLAQDFLAMYSATDRAALRSRLVPPAELSRHVAAAGFWVDEIRPFMTFPDAVASAASLSADGPAWIELLAALDEAARARARDGGGAAVGQLFVLFADKHGPTATELDRQ